MESNEALVSEYLYSVGPRLSIQARESLTRMTHRILRYADEVTLSFPSCTLQDAMDFYTWVSEKDITIGTVCNYLKTARRFFNYLVQTERISSNPFLDLAYPRMPHHISRNVLSETQMHRLLRELGQFDILPTKTSRIRRYRIHVLAEFLYATGLRIAEAASLTIGNLDLKARVVYVPKGKGGEARTAFLGSYGAELMEVYVKEGRALVLGSYARSHGTALFGTHHERLMAVMNHELRELCTSLSLPIITSHGFRHSLGTHLLRAGCDLRYIQAILGHEKLGSTQVYTHVDKDDLKQSLDSFHPRVFNKREVYEA